MKLGIDVNTAVLTNTGATSEFKIRNSAKAFSILSSGLYSNKIRAIIRELSCNAVDSHVAAGKEDILFEVHLPTFLEPWFSVRDFGLGLSGDQVNNIYTTYFESTKTDSNEFIGALGLGSKSPFSYTENFTITAIKDGYKRIYSAYINEHGIPCVAEMSVELTDENNGVEIKFSVTNRYDYQSFQTEAKEVYSYFKNKPRITGVDSYTHSEIFYTEKDIAPGIHYLRHSDSMAIMGNIAYPLRKIPEPKKHFGNLSDLLECGIHIEFDIGDLDFAASREELSYIPSTINSIKNKLELLNNNLAKYIADKADIIDNKWLRAAYLMEQYNVSLFRSAVAKYVLDTKFGLFDIKDYHGKKVFTFDADDIQKRGLSFSSLRVSNSKFSKVSISSKDYTTKGYKEKFNFYVQKNIIFVLNDLKIGAISRIRNAYEDKNGYTIICVNHSSSDIATRIAEYDKFMTDLCEPPVIVKASELPKITKQKSISSTGIVKLEIRDHRRPGYEDSYKWNIVKDDLPATDTYYYVPLSNNLVLDEKGNNTQIDIFSIKAYMDSCDVPAIRDIVVYGVRKSRLKEITGLKNWVNIQLKLKEEVDKIPNSFITKSVVSDIVDYYYNKCYTNKEVVKLLDSNSDYSIFNQKYSTAKKSIYGSSSVLQLVIIYGRAAEIDTAKSDINDDLDKIKKKYPLLAHISSAPEKEIANYIKLVDTKEKI